MKKLIRCQIQGCKKQADYGLLAKGERYEWTYMCGGHKAHLQELNDEVRDIIDTPPFCDEFSARLPCKD